MTETTRRYTADELAQMPTDEPWELWEAARLARSGAARTRRTGSGAPHRAGSPSEALDDTLERGSASRMRVCRGRRVTGSALVVCQPCCAW